MTYLQGLLTQQQPLEQHEAADLKRWLETLESDCASFGETPEDTQQMNAIRRRIGAAHES